MSAFAVPTHLRLIAALGAALMAAAAVVAVSAPVRADNDEVPVVASELLTSGSKAATRAEPITLAVDEIDAAAFITIPAPDSGDVAVLYYGEGFSRTRELDASCQAPRIVARAVECFNASTGEVRVETYAGDLIHWEASTSRIMSHPTGWVEWNINDDTGRREIVNVTVNSALGEVSHSVLFDHIQYPQTDADVVAHYSSPYVSYARIVLSGTSQAGIYELIVWDGDFDDVHWHFMPGGEPVVGTFAEGLLRESESDGTPTLTYLTSAGEQFTAELPKAFDIMSFSDFIDVGGNLTRLAHQGWWQVSAANEFVQAANPWWSHDFLTHRFSPGFVAPYQGGYLAAIGGEVIEVDANGPVGEPLAQLPRADVWIQVIGVYNNTAYWADTTQPGQMQTVWSYDLATGGPAQVVAQDVIFASGGPTTALDDGQLWVVYQTDNSGATFGLKNLLGDGPHVDLEVSLPLLSVAMTDTHVVVEACMFALGAAADVCDDHVDAAIAINRVTGDLSLEPSALNVTHPFDMRNISAGGRYAIEVTERATGTTVFTSPFYDTALWFNTWTNTLAFRAQDEGVWSACVGLLDGQNAPPVCAQTDLTPRLISDDLVALYSPSGNNPQGFDVYSTDTMEPVESVRLDAGHGEFSGLSQAIETDGYVMFTTDSQDSSGNTNVFLHLARYEAPGAVQWFSDVGAGHTFFVEIDWLARQGITGGYDDGTFRPGSHVSRQAMAAFLYRFAGEPEFVAPTTASFADVPTSHSFFKEIEWLVAEGITEGYDDGTFRGGAHVSRQAMAAFLARFVGGDLSGAPATPSFGDVPTSHVFFSEIEWLVGEGITEGYDDGTFRPGAHVSRQAMAAFLMRLAAPV